MLLSYNWLKEFIDIEQGPDELESILTMLGIEVDGIIDYRKKYSNFFTATVETCVKHPDADKLTVCTVECGKGPMQVICGAPNVAAGQKVVLGIDGAVVPNGGFELGKRKIRGVESNGMICSQVELETGEDSSGIWVLPEETKPGIPLYEYLGMDDTIFEVSLTPNRADCLSHFGVARDLSAYLNIPCSLPVRPLNETGSPVENSISIEILDAEKCPRYTARVVRNAKIAPSPDWLKNKLIAAGLRPLNNVVDITNYIMLETGQPLHAFDLDKIAGNNIVIRTASEGEKFTTLDGKERTLDSQMLMICDAERAVAIGGVMGGENSEITGRTSNILLESAYFNPSNVRRTAKKLGIQSDSSYRFERGVDYSNTAVCNTRAAAMIAELTGGEVEKGIVDEFPQKPVPATIKLRFERTRKITGIDISNARIREIILALNFLLVSEDEDSITVTSPSYRFDMELEIDLIEEVARLYNYNNIVPLLKSSVDFGIPELSGDLGSPRLRNNIRDFLINRGYNETLTQNITDPFSASVFGEESVEISNPLGEDLSRMRTSLIPSMLRTINRNIRMGNQSLRLFDIGKSFHLNEDSGLSFLEGISEREDLIVALTGQNNKKHWSEPEREVDFYDIKGVLEEIVDFLQIKGAKLKLDKEAIPGFGGNALNVIHKSSIIGKLGEINTKLLKQYDIEHKVFVLEFDLNYIYKLEYHDKKYEKVAPFPGIARDLSFVVADDVPSGAMLNEIIQNGGSLLKEASIFDVYKGKNIDDGKKSIAFAMNFAAPDRTLKDEEIDKITAKVIKVIEQKFNASLRS